MNNLNQTFVENVTFNKPACWESHPNVREQVQCQQVSPLHA